MEILKISPTLDHEDTRLPLPTSFVIPAPPPPPTVQQTFDKAQTRRTMWMGEEEEL